LEGVAEDAGPSFDIGQLLRSFPQHGEEPGNPLESRCHLLAPAVARSHRQPGLAGMPGLPRHRVQQQGTGGQRFVVMIGIGQADIPRPPVVDQGGDAPHDLAALPVL